MGQYYKACLITEDHIKVVRPDGWKMMEHSWYGNTAMKRIEKILYKNPCRVIWVGDYSQCAPFCWEYKQEDEEDINRDAEEEELDLLKREEDKEYLLINNFRKEYINMTKQEMNEELFQGRWNNVIHPLWLLCRAETEEAGGDYHSEVGVENIGRWCGDEIYVMEKDQATEELKYYDDMTDVYFFKEE